MGSGLSKYNDSEKDGAETIAEGFVKKRNGEPIPKSVYNLVEEYVESHRRKK